MLSRETGGGVVTEVRQIASSNREPCERLSKSTRESCCSRESCSDYWCFCIIRTVSIFESFAGFQSHF